MVFPKGMVDLQFHKVFGNGMVELNCQIFIECMLELGCLKTLSDECMVYLWCLKLVCDEGIVDLWSLKVVPHEDMIGLLCHKVVSGDCMMTRVSKWPLINL